MEELVKELVEKVGLSEEKAKESVEVITEFVKGKLPSSLSGQVENIMNGEFNMSSLFGFGGGSKGGEKSNPLDALKGFLKK